MPSRVSIYRNLDQVRRGFGPSALSIGNFDGVHIAHRRILRRVAETARANGWKASVLTFDPHPTKVVAPERAPQLLTTPEERVRLMREEGIEQAVILPFDRGFADMSPEEFVERVVVGALGARAVLVGENFRFGNRQAGDTKKLAVLGLRYGFRTEVIPGIRMRGRMVSSSEVRRLIASGDAGLAARLLGRPYALEGSVVAGHGIGSKKTVPTLNLGTSAGVLPATGVYVTRTTDLEDSRSWPSVTNIGYRPTFGGDPALSIETFLLAALEGGNPRRIRVEFLRRLREERKFENPEILKAQIMRDVARALAYHRRCERWVKSGAAVPIVP